MLVESGSDLAADVLKVAHHGSRTSSTAEFLKKVGPGHAVISVADPSPYGHPHAEISERLRVSGARIWQTSACGAITISTDGRDLRVATFVKCE
jgi:competence protein ComEC